MLNLGLGEFEGKGDRREERRGARVARNGRTNTSNVTLAKVWLGYGR